jgi:hypothetical protein
LERKSHNLQWRVVNAPYLMANDSANRRDFLKRIEHAPTNMRSEKALMQFSTANCPISIDHFRRIGHVNHRNRMNTGPSPPRSPMKALGTKELKIWILGLVSGRSQSSYSLSWDEWSPRTSSRDEVPDHGLSTKTLIYLMKLIHFPSSRNWVEI